LIDNGAEMPYFLFNGVAVGTAGLDYVRTKREHEYSKNNYKILKIVVD